MVRQHINRREFLRIAGSSAILGVGLPGCSIFQTGSADPLEFDVLIKNGLIVDGSGESGYPGSIGIIDDKIAAIGSLDHAIAPQIIDATNLVVAPGFINIHGHTDGNLLTNPEGTSSVMQGVTLELGGQCGGSRGWNIGEFLDELDDLDIGINFATMVGHGTVRNAVIGSTNRDPNTQELEQMRQMIDQAIQGGAVGLSTGLEYTPGNFSKTPELIEIARALKPYQLPYATHMRNEDRSLLEAVEESLMIGREADCPVQISHLKALGKPNWHKIDPLFKMLEIADKERGNVHFDRYPYIAYSTGLSIIFPTWSKDGGNQRFLERLQDASLQQRIRADVQVKIDQLQSWHAIMVTSVRHEDDRKYIGFRVDDIARDKGADPFEEAVALLLRNNGSVSTVGFGMDEENTRRILSHPLGMIGSDGSAMPLAGGMVHPRSFGTFARVLGYYCREEKIFDLPTAVKKMTSMPAEKLRIDRRGKLEKGFYADIAIFDPATVKDTATFEKPRQLPLGVNHVLVNGKLTVQNGEHTGTLAGRPIRFKA
ncbi:MAG: D-aminoacylase [Planctomycetes bacterium]|nr:D-aminoacylase [Planctomycetota bacterium]